MLEDTNSLDGAHIAMEEGLGTMLMLQTILWTGIFDLFVIIFPLRQYL